MMFYDRDNEQQELLRIREMACDKCVVAQQGDSVQGPDDRCGGGYCGAAGRRQESVGGRSEAQEGGIQA